jgi:hypothetical protein
MVLTIDFLEIVSVYIYIYIYMTSYLELLQWKEKPLLGRTEKAVWKSSPGDKIQTFGSLELVKTVRNRLIYMLEKKKRKKQRVMMYNCAKTPSFSLYISMWWINYVLQSQLPYLAEWIYKHDGACPGFESFCHCPNFFPSNVHFFFPIRTMRWGRFYEKIEKRIQLRNVWNIWNVIDKIFYKTTDTTIILKNTEGIFHR